MERFSSSYDDSESQLSVVTRAGILAYVNVTGEERGSVLINSIQNDGEIVGIGKHIELIKTVPYYKKLVDAQNVNL